MANQKLTDKNIRALGWSFVKSSEYWQQYSAERPKGDEASLMVFNTGFAHLDITNDSASVEEFSIDWLLAAMQALKIPILENANIPPSPEAQLERLISLCETALKYNGNYLYEEAFYAAMGKIRAFLAEVKGGQDG